jgi:hypothetical protein
MVENHFVKNNIKYQFVKSQKIIKIKKLIMLSKLPIEN